VNAFLGQLGQKLAERWLTLLVLPGALYLAAAACARALGQAHPATAGRISAQITAWSRSQTGTTTAGQMLLLAAILALAAAAGLAAQALGAGIERAVLAADWHSWPFLLRRLADWRTAQRQQQWDAAHQQYSSLYRAAAPAGAVTTDEDRARRLALRQIRTQISAERPQRPTWSGDRINAAAVRLKRDRHLDLGTLWPHLWLTMPDATRTQVTEARQNLARATTLGGWAILYATLTWWWWPVIVLAAGLATTAHHRLRVAAGSYATVLEAAATLHTRELAASLGILDADSTSAETGEALMSLLISAPPLAEDK
jgi:hypothetical protein